MQNIVIAKPYRFVPPYRKLRWVRFLTWWVPRTARKSWGVEWPTFRGLEHLRASLAAGHSVILAPNHCRPCDPIVVGLTCIPVQTPCYIMASWHLFMQGRIQRFLMRRAGAFSVYREGVDRESIRTAIDAIVEGDRLLILFAEGMVRRANDELGDLMDGTAFIARSAAKQRARSGARGGVVIHPVVLRYTFPGDLRAAVEPVLSRLEQRFSWQPQRSVPLLDRVRKLDGAFLAVKEVEYLGAAQTGSTAERVARLTDAVLQPLEQTYLNGKSDPAPMERVKKLRAAILPALIPGDLPAGETQRRWRHLADCYFAQQLASYPAGYLDGQPTVERILESVERLEEDLTDVATIHRPMHCQIEVGPAIPVEPERPRGEDPLMAELRAGLQRLIASSAALCRPWKEAG